MITYKAIIIIAVSKYNGSYSNLPGAITSARRLREWAEHKEPSRDYKVLYLADDEYEKIDYQLVSEKVTNFIKSNFIDRLVVYFSGHGIARSIKDEYWLLTDAANDKTQGIHLGWFKGGLDNCNIKQLCIISDACRDTNRDAIDFCGHPILTSRKKTNRNPQLDLFLSTGLGESSYQINPTDGKPPYCLFSDAILNGLDGVRETVEFENHQFKPAVTNHKLKTYLDEEVRISAAGFSREMNPEIIPGIIPPYNFYKLFEEKSSDEIFSSQESQPIPIIQIAANNTQRSEDDDQLTELQKSRRQTLLQWKDPTTLGNILNGRNRIDYSIISDFRPDSIALPNNSTVVISPNGQFHEIQPVNCDNYPVLIHQDEHWILIPNYPCVVTAISRNLPGDILFLKTDLSAIRQLQGNFDREIEDNEEDGLLDTYLSDFSNLIGSLPLRIEDAENLVNEGNHFGVSYFHKLVTAGYLYKFYGNYDKIVRNAQFLNWKNKLIPFDLALLCADKIWWRKKNNKWVAFADLPGVKGTGDRKGFEWWLKAEFEELKNVQLLGITPIFRQGWGFMQTELYLEIPEKIRQIGENMLGRSAVNLTDKGLEMFIEAFDYQVVEIGR